MGELVPAEQGLGQGSAVSLPLAAVRRYLWLPDSARSMGINIMAGKGSGKSRLLGRLIAWLDFVRGVPLVIFDPVGGTIDNFLDKIVRLPDEQQRAAWSRVRYVDAAGFHGHVVPAPLYYRLGSESLYSISQRYLDVVRKLDPHLQSASILGWNAVWRMGTMTGILLAALGMQITEAAAVLADPQGFVHRYAATLSSYPEVQPAVSFFNDLAALKPAERSRLVESFLNKIAMFSLDPAMTAMFGTTEPGIDWGRAIAQRQAVLFDFRHVPDIERRRFLMWWLLGYFVDYIRHRGHGRHTPVGLIVDELTALLNFQSLGADPFLEDLDALINVVARSHQVWLTTSLQQVWQVDPRIAKALLSMGTQVIGAVSDPLDARILAQHLYRFDPGWVKKREPVWMASQLSPYVVDHTTAEYSSEEQDLLNSYLLRDTGLFRFLVRPAAHEGDVLSDLQRMSIANLDRGIWVDEVLVSKARRLLAAHGGLPVAQLLPPIHNRLLMAPVVKSEPRRDIVTAQAYAPLGSDLSSQDDETPVFWEEAPHGYSPDIA